MLKPVPCPCFSVLREGRDEGRLGGGTQVRVENKRELRRRTGCRGWGCGVPANWAAGQSERGLSTMAGRACEPFQVLSCRVVTKAASSCQAGDALVKCKSGHAFFCPEALAAPCCMQKKAQVLTVALEVLPCWPRCSLTLPPASLPALTGFWKLPAKLFPEISAWPSHLAKLSLREAFPDHPSPLPLSWFNYYFPQRLSSSSTSSILLIGLVCGSPVITSAPSGPGCCLFVHCHVPRA